jgi:hypothetical protein
MKLQSLFRFTSRDAEFQSRMAHLTERREEMDLKADELFKATLDHEGEWFLMIAKKNPVCVLKAAIDCMAEKGN